MKTNIDRVYSKLPNKKQSFKKHNVNLDKAQDLKDALEKSNENWDLMNDVLNDWVVKYIDLQNEVNSISDLYDSWIASKENLEDVMIDFEDVSKELGMNPMTFTGFSESSFALGVYDQNIDDLQDTIDIMKTIPQL